tara:strand:+ start:79 stop:477 length:399 start_codon:yes stop_codon:yes gene_type:complete
MIENRPWGTFEVLLETEYTKVKEIVVLPKQRLSLQYHHHRSEVWTIVKGDGEFTDGENGLSVCAGDVLEIKEGDKHRITAGDGGVTFIEVQLSLLGKTNVGIFDEEDIIRLEDDYNRSIIDEIRKNQGHPHE